MPAQVKALDDRSAREVQIIEYLQRQDVHPLERSTATQPDFLVPLLQRLIRQLQSQLGAQQAIGA